MWVVLITWKFSRNARQVAIFLSEPVREPRG